MASSLSKWLVDPKKNWFAAQHMKSVSTRLRRYGLRYDDLYDPYYDLDVKEALNRLPREIVDARSQRLKRAMDLSMKHEYLPNGLQLNVLPANCENHALGIAPSFVLNPLESFVPFCALLYFSVVGKQPCMLINMKYLNCRNLDKMEMQTPFRSYLQDMLALVKRENAEREALGALPLYQRCIP
ncbi:unnamed protein product [Camellia sinensis]